MPPKNKAKTPQPKGNKQNTVKTPMSAPPMKKEPAEDDDDDSGDEEMFTDTKGSLLFSEKTGDAVESAKGDYDDEDEEDDSAPAKRAKMDENKQKKTQDSDSQDSGVAVGGDAKPKQALSADERDRRTLFMKNFPEGTRAEDIKALSEDIQDVRVRMRRVKRSTLIYAFLEFDSEEIAEANYKKLEGTVMKKNKLMIDYVGEKSKNAPEESKKPKTDKEVDPLKLYVTGIEKTRCTESFLRPHFPRALAIEVPFNRNKPSRKLGFAFIRYANEEFCKEAYERNQDKPFVVLHAYRRIGEVNPFGPSKPQQRKPIGKSFVPAQKPDDDDDSDDNDEEEEKKEELKAEQAMDDDDDDDD